MDTASNMIPLTEHLPPFLNVATFLKNLLLWVQMFYLKSGLHFKDSNAGEETFCLQMLPSFAKSLNCKLNPFTLNRIILRL